MRYRCRAVYICAMLMRDKTLLLPTPTAVAGVGLLGSTPPFVGDLSVFFFGTISQSPTQL